MERGFVSMFKPMEFNLTQRLLPSQLCTSTQQGDKTLAFDVHIYKDVLKESEFKKLRADIEKIELHRKDNDLYKFRQSKDLRYEVGPLKMGPDIKDFVRNIIGPVRKKMEMWGLGELSLINLDITVSRYNQGDYLLCHNDDIKIESKHHKRVLAFVYYLTSKPWSFDDGGSLLIYDSDSNGEPIQLNNRIPPNPNSLVIFKTSPTSWHSVEEVFRPDDTRWSINGWFHLDKLKPEAEITKNPLIELDLYHFFRPKPVDNRIEKFFADCISEQYLVERSYYAIRKKFKRTSEINLTNFLKKDKYEQICTALKEAVNEEKNMKEVGPYNKRNYKRLEVSNLPQVCKDLYAAFQSEMFFLLLNRLTGLDLRPVTLKRGDDTTSEEDETDESEEQSSSSETESNSGSAKEEDDKSDQTSEEEEATEVSEQDDATNGDVDNSGNSENIPDNDGKSSTSKRSESSCDGAKKRVRLADPIGRAEFRHLEPGSYTLLHDHDFEVNESSALDVMLHFNHDFEADHAKSGGYFSYIDAGDKSDIHESETELLSVEPKSNCLSLVYRGDKDTCRFLKYISRSHKSSYQDLSCVYYERPDELPNKGVGVHLE